MDTVLNLLSSYPETNPYDIEPPIFNLIPDPILEAAHDTEEFRKALRDQTRAYGMNPFIYQYGVCPLMPTARDVLEALKIPMDNYTSPPPLPEACIVQPLEFLEEINPTGRVPIFKVRVHYQEGTSDIRALKLVSIAVNDVSSANLNRNSFRITFMFAKRIRRQNGRAEESVDTLRLVEHQQNASPSSGMRTPTFSFTGFVPRALSRCVSDG